MESLDTFLGGPYTEADDRGKVKSERLIIVETDQDYSNAIRFAMNSSRRRVSVVLGEYVGPSEARASDSDLIILDLRHACAKRRQKK